MIASVTGHLASAGLDWVVVEVGGIGVKLSVPPSTVNELASRGRSEKISLATTLIVREDALMLYGFSTGCCFNLCMLLISLRTNNAARATSLSGMVQSLGYAVGAIGPILGGWPFDLTGNWNATFACVGILIVIIFFSGRQAGKNIYI